MASGQLAAALCTLGQLEEAEELAGTAERLSAADDVVSQMLWRQTRARLLARRGAHDDAERLALAAVSLVEDTDMLNWHGRARSDLADVYELADRPDDAGLHLELALALYERKGNRVEAAQVRERLGRLPEAAVVLDSAAPDLVPDAEPE